MNGRTFRFTGKIEQFSFENGKLKIDWVFPDAGKPFNSNHDFAYIELAPKYDPCRKLRKGDRVREVLVKGRRFDDDYPEYFMSETSTVVIEEDNLHFVRIKHPNGEQHSYDAVYLELVTPVEELEPYSVEEYVDFYAVEKDGAKYSIFLKGSYYSSAKAAAEAERDRLNAEYRKEKNND